VPGSTICRPALMGRDWPISYRSSSSSISRSSSHRLTARLRPRLTEALHHHNHQTRRQQHKEVDNSRSAGAHCRRQDRGGESSYPVMSRSPDRRSSLERGSPETKPRSCGNQPAHESLFNRRLRVLSPAVRTSKPTSSATAEQIVASGPLKANMRAGCGKNSAVVLGCPDLDPGPDPEAMDTDQDID
jgi:hypothetical protein